MPTMLVLSTIGCCGVMPLRLDYEAIQQSIVEELKQVPPPNSHHDADAPAMPRWTDKELARYQAGGVSFGELRQLLAKEPERHPLRAATLRAIETLQQEAKLAIVETLRPAAKAGKQDKQKTLALAAQKRAGIALFEIEQRLSELEGAGPKRDQEKSPRWQAHYDYVKLVCLARLVVLSDYNYALGGIRSERLPPLPEGAKGWRLVTAEKIGIPEARVKAWNRQLVEMAETIQRDHPNTPWSFLADRERRRPRGVEWRVEP